MMEEQQLLLLPLSQPHPLLEEEPQPPQKNKRMMIHQKFPPLLLFVQLQPVQPHPLFGLVLLQSLHPQLDKSPIKSLQEIDYSIWYSAGMTMFPVTFYFLKNYKKTW